MRNKEYDPFTDDYFEFGDGRGILIMDAFKLGGIPYLTVCVFKESSKGKESVDCFDIRLDDWREAMRDEEDESEST